MSSHSSACPLGDAILVCMDPQSCSQAHLTTLPWLLACSIQVLLTAAPSQKRYAATEGVIQEGGTDWRTACVLTNKVYHKLSKPLSSKTDCCRGAGSALLQKPDRLEVVMRGVASQLSCAVTLKLRTGYTSGHDIAHSLLPRVASWGVTAATLHGRSRTQR